ncbi:M50 family metallopeptidase [Guptibacillus algicola]|uniref:M50 family metallopeptidase n=1 Tax=Guptibacillus algicola TaxID=225844 RepID=UPI001CD5A705|nr:M50 family metallopeptidase [Alkalihalobacillus algicola]MCA0986209.1 M50 family metallopeptidase [Alkalihalobacillus algicola]
MTGRFKEVILLFSIVLIHELGHAVAAHYYRWRISKIVLLPFGGVAVVDEHGNRPIHEEFMVILAGPLQHLWMVGAGFVLFEAGMMSDSLFNLFIFHNMIVLLFNLLPIWPLDGGKLLFLLYTIMFPYKAAHRHMIYSSGVFLLILILLTLLWFPEQLSLWLVISFLAAAHFKEWKHHPYVYFRFLLDRYTKEYNGKEATLSVLPHMRVSEVLSLLYRGKRYSISIKELDVCADEQVLLEAYFRKKQIRCAVGTLFR